MKILIFGSTGKVGSELVKALGKDHTLITPSHKDMDIANTYLCGYIVGKKPDLIINAAAYNGMENCQNFPTLAYVLNSSSPAIMAEAAKILDVPFIHFSTDYVFDGIKIDQSPSNATFAYGYREELPPLPASVYSRSKTLGEMGVFQTCGKNLIFRVSTIYDRTFKGPLDPLQQFIDGAGTEERPIKVIHQLCTPTSAVTIATAIAHVVNTVSQWENYVGIYHLCSKVAVWRDEFLEYILYGRIAAYERIELEIPRPVFSYMNSVKFENTFNYTLPTVLNDFQTTFPNYKDLLSCRAA